MATNPTNPNDKNKIDDVSGLGDFVNNMADAAGGMGHQMQQIEGLMKDVGSVRQVFSNLNNVLGDFQSMMKGIINQGNQMGGQEGGGQGGRGQRGALMNAGIETQRQVLDDLVKNWGKATSSGKPYATTEAARETG